jgi:hypothetical protein
MLASYEIHTLRKCAIQVVCTLLLHRVFVHSISTDNFLSCPNIFNSPQYQSPGIIFLLILNFKLFYKQGQWYIINNAVPSVMPPTTVFGLIRRLLVVIIICPLGR